jgi:protoporphyrinogen oxidase
VISTVSLPLLACWLRPSMAATAAQLRYRAVRFLNLQLDRPQVSPHTWMYVSEPRYRMTRIQEPRHRSPEMSPPGKTSLMLEIPCAVDDDTWTAPEAALRDRCLADLRTLGIDVAAAVRGSFSTFVEEGYPIYSLGYADHQRALLATVATVPNLLSLGRQGTFRYVFMDIAMEMGLEAARQILARAPNQPHFLSFRNDRQLIEAQSLTA